MFKSPTSGRLRAQLSPFAIVEKLLVLTSLALVVMTVGSKLGPLIGLTGRPGTAVAVAAALTLDALWLGASARANQAIRQRNWAGAWVMGWVTLLSIGASVAALAILGHASVYAAVPVVSLAFTGLRIFSESTMADDVTTRSITERSAADRNAAALAASEARQRLAEATTGVVLDTADHLASLERDVALARRLTRADVRMAKVRAKAQEKLATSEKRHGAASRLFLERVTPVTSTVTTPVTDAVTRLVVEAPQASDLRDVPTTASDADVTQAVTSDWEDEIPEAHIVPASELLALGVTVVTSSFPSQRDGEEGGGVTGRDAVLTSETGCDTGVTQSSTGPTLEELAALAGVPVPEPCTKLTEDQIEVVLRWLRYQMDPPRSYRRAAELFRKGGFGAPEGKLRLVWKHIEATEEQLTGSAPTD